MGLLEQGRDFLIGKACDATADAGNEECQVLTALGKLDKLIHIGFDGLHPTLHRGNAIATALQTNTLAHDGNKLPVGDPRRSTSMHTGEVTAEDEDLSRP